MGIGPGWDLIVLQKVRTDTSYSVHPLCQAYSCIAVTDLFLREENCGYALAWIPGRLPVWQGLYLGKALPSLLSSTSSSL